MAAIRFESPWFRCFCAALLTEDPDLRRKNVKAALDEMQETLRRGGLSQDERMAIAAAIRQLNVLELNPPRIPSSSASTRRRLSWAE